MFGWGRYLLLWAFWGFPSSFIFFLVFVLDKINPSWQGLGCVWRLVGKAAGAETSWGAAPAVPDTFASVGAEQELSRKTGGIWEFPAEFQIPAPPLLVQPTKIHPGLPKPWGSPKKPTKKPIKVCPRRLEVPVWLSSAWWGCCEGQFCSQSVQLKENGLIWVRIKWINWERSNNPPKACPKPLSTSLCVKGGGNWYLHKAVVMWFNIKSPTDITLQSALLRGCTGHCWISSYISYI